VDRVRELYEWQPERVSASEIAKYAIPASNGSYQEPPPQQIIIPETPEASEIFREFDEETVRQGDANPPLACLWKKGEENARRVALIVHCSDSNSSMDISGVTARYSCDLVRYILESFVTNIAPEIVSNEIERRKRQLLRIVQQAGHCGISRGQLSKRSPWTDGSGRTKLVDDLVCSGEIALLPGDGGLRYFFTGDF
jgi:hypothetical protein